MNILSNLNKNQIKAVTYDKGPLLIVAGAGTGKTTVITKRIGWLIVEKKIDPQNILALTFTDKAAGEMEERVDIALPLGYVDLQISTFHSFGQRVLKEHGIDIGLADNLQVLTDSEKWFLIRKNLDKFKLDYYKPLGNPTRFISALINHISRCKNEQITICEYLDYAAKLKMEFDSVEGVYKKMNDLSKEEKEKFQEMLRINELAECFHTYQQLMLENNYLDFDDLINFTIKLFKERPKILNYYKKKFEYIFVDEFQDTNLAQYQLIKLLTDKNSKITVVGDDDQSIYRFRGASMSNILKFKTDYPKTQEIFLTQNYRSKQNLLDKAYEFIQLNNPNRLEVQLKNNSKSELNKKLISSEKGEGIIKHIHKETLDEEVISVIDEIIDIYKNNDKVNWSDFAILIRANNQADPFIDECERRGLPYIFLAAKGLYFKPIIIDLSSYLRLLCDYYDSTAAFRVLNMQRLDIDYKDLMAIMNFSKRKAISLFETCQRINETYVSLKTKKKVLNLLNLIEKHSVLVRNKAVFKAVYQIIIDLQYLNFLNKLPERKYIENISYLNQFLKIIKNFEKNNIRPLLKDFIEYLDLCIQAGDQGGLYNDLDIGPDSIKILTIHGAKGLEFKYVFIVNLVDRRFPTVEKKSPIEIPDEIINDELPDYDTHLEEERRLFYVALTRAKQGIFLSSARDYGGARKKKLSVFLNNLGFYLKDDKHIQIKENNKELKFGKFEPDDLFTNNNIDYSSLIPLKFSFTQLKTFEECPWKYRFAHILKVPTQIKAPLAFGQTMHNTLQKFFQKILSGVKVNQTSLFGNNDLQKREPSLDELLEIYGQSWIDDGYISKTQKQNYKQKGVEQLTEFYNIHKGKFPRPLFLEKGFNLKINDNIIVGKIDRVDLKNEKVEIVDYKTGKVPRFVKEIDKWNKYQLLIYQLAAEQVFKFSVSQVIFYYLTENKQISFLGTKADLNKLKQEVSGIIERIKKSDFAPSPAPHKCKFCDYNSICEYRKM
jgi:DNA helicase-2/ATP-dependent DNA helicase PcrA